MQTWSPTLEGFRTLFRKPAVALAEIAWRWTFAAAALTLCTLAMVEYLDSLPVSGRNLLLLRTAHPVLISHALSQIMRGSGLRFVLAAALLFVSLSLLWILLASIGRTATLHSLIMAIRDRARLAGEFLNEFSTPVEPRGVRYQTIRTMAGLSFLRAGLAVAMGASLVGAIVVSNLVSSDKHPRPGLVFFVFASLTLAIACAWMLLNWFLSLATIFAERDGMDTFSALAAAERLVRERFGAVFVVGTWFGIAHLSLFVLATSAVGFPLSFAAIVPPGFTLLAIGVITLAYFALADGLYIGRLAGYIAILEAPALPQLSASTNLPAASPRSKFIDPFAVTMVDQEELILSDRTQGRLSPEPRLADIEMIAPIIAGVERAMVDQNETILSDKPTVETGLAQSETQQAAPQPPFADDPSKP